MTLTPFPPGAQAEAIELLRSNTAPEAVVATLEQPERGAAKALVERLVELRAKALGAQPGAELQQALVEGKQAQERKNARIGVGCGIPLALFGASLVSLGWLGLSAGAQSTTVSKEILGSGLAALGLGVLSVVRGLRMLRSLRPPGS